MVGVIISSGIVNSASTTDDGSYVDDKGKRKCFGMVEQDQLEIESIMKSRHDIGVYNEIVVSDPEIAGIYLKLDSPRKERNGIEVDFKSHFKPDQLSKIYNTMNSCIHQNYDKRLPMFAIINGEVREMKININEINTYLPSYNGQKVNDVHDYDSAVLREYDSKIELWNKMNDSEFFDKIITLGNPLTQIELMN